MLKKFLDFINRHQLVTAGSKSLIAVSGGIDSVVLTMLFKEAGFHFAIAHCNFQLRGDESDTDEAFVKALAKAVGVNYFVRSFDTKNYAGAEGVSTQMAARDLRYAWFRQLVQDHQFDSIATAHHLDDSLETVIHNLTRGTGISGLRGILPKTNNVIRPLLFASKKEIMEYAQDKKLQWREDSSNVSVKYKRNLIRHKVLPVLREINPSLEATFFHSWQRIADAEGVVMDAVAALKAHALEQHGNDVYISIGAVKKARPVLVEELLKPYGFNFQQVRELMEALEVPAAGKVFGTDRYMLNVDRGYLIISPAGGEVTERLINSADEEVSNEVLTLQMQPGAPGKILTGKHEATVDYDMLKFPLKLRKWRIGDTFQPLGMKGKKKVSDFMIDEKIPLNLKERICVLESDGDIVWLVGHRLDERFKVSFRSKTICNFVIYPNDKSI